MDMRKLVEQTLIEMDDKITSSGFEIITAYDVENAQFQGRCKPDVPGRTKCDR